MFASPPFPACCGAPGWEKPPSRMESGAGGGMLRPIPARRGGGRTGSCLSLCPLFLPQA